MEETILFKFVFRDPCAKRLEALGSFLANLRLLPLQLQLHFLVE